MEMAVNCAQWTLCSIKQIIATTRSETQELPLVYGREKEREGWKSVGWRNGRGEKRKGARWKWIGMHIWVIQMYSELEESCMNSYRPTNSLLTQYSKCRDLKGFLVAGEVKHNSCAWCQHTRQEGRRVCVHVCKWGQLYVQCMFNHLLPSYLFVNPVRPNISKYSKKVILWTLHVCICVCHRAGKPSRGTR